MEYFNTAVHYGRELGNKVLGVEGFVADSSGNTVIKTNEIVSAGASILTYSFFLVVIGILVAFGAARQSYCYNIYIGNTEGEAILFAILCFLFPQFYYPFYALFLNPVCDLGKKNKGIMGGLIGGRRR
jgi:hypothetical protein